MLRKTLISGAAVAALAFAGAAFAQSPSGGASSTSPSPNANPNASGTAPGLQNNRNDVPRGSPGSEHAQERTGTSGSATTQSQSRGSSSNDRMTTGQVPRIEISPTQRTELRTHFQKANLRTVTRDQINVAIAVGTVLPSTVTFAPVPDPVIALVPQFRGYQAVRVGDQILIVEPGTRRIVYIIEA